MATTTCVEHHDRESTRCCGNIKPERPQAILRKRYLGAIIQTYTRERRGQKGESISGKREWRARRRARARKLLKETQGIHSDLNTSARTMKVRKEGEMKLER